MLSSLMLAVSVLGTQIPTPAPAAPTLPFNYSVMYDIKSKETIPIVGVRIGALPRFLGTKLQPETWAIGGLNLNTQQPATGFAAVLPYKFSTNGTLFILGAVRVENGEPASVGLVGGLQLKF